MSGPVRLKSVEPTPTAVVRRTTTWSEFPTAWGPMLDAVWAFLRGAAADGLYQKGHNVMLYLDDVPRVEVGVQVSGDFVAAGEVVPSTLPGGRVAVAVHRGPIGGIGETHSAVRRWCEESDHRLTGIRWEIYGDPDPQTGDFDVEVRWLLAEP